MTRRRRHGLAALAVVLVVAAAAVAGMTLAGSDPAGQARGEAEFPTALAGHLDQLRQAVPGNQGMAEEGPAGAAEAAFLQRAYPDDTIAVADMDAARAAFTAATKRPFAKNKKPGTWIPVGPSEALYPDTEFRNSFSYVPNEYVAGGRTTSIALRQNCSPGECRMWITPAGGGLWRTNDALAATPSWTYLGGPLGINAAGSVTLDPNDPNENTI